jgi:uncharacterized protein
MPIHSGRPAATRLTDSGGLPARAGIGVKSEHARELVGASPALGFVEVHAENYMGAGGPPHAYLASLRERYPLSVHGVGLSIGGDAPLDEAHLERLERLMKRYEPQSFSEHLAWSSHDGLYLNDLLPVAYTTETLKRVVAHIDQLHERLRRHMLLENPASYLAFAASDWDEVDFLAEIVRRTGCGVLLDINNLQVTCVNHGRDPYAYLEALPAHAVGEVHLAGYAEDMDAAGTRLLIDAHGSPVASDVWSLYECLLRRIGPRPTLIEWDNEVPSLATLLAEAGKADARLAAVSRRRSEGGP